MARINNSDARRYVNRKEPFIGSNLYGELEPIKENVENYVVCSYGSHFPIYVFDELSGRWFGNQDKYSRSTTRHQTQARPDTRNITFVDTKTIQDIAYKGLHKLIAKRVNMSTY